MTWPRQTRTGVARALAAAFLAGEWERAAMTSRAAEVLGRRPRWLGVVVDDARAAHPSRPAGAPRALAASVDWSLLALDEGGRLPQPPRHVPPAHFVPEMKPARWPVPAVSTPANLAALLDLHPGELAWLADRRSLERRAALRLRNYRYRWLARPGGPPRLIEQPKALLKETQRRILHGILDAIPPHEAAHGFRRGHSAVTHARRHTAQEVVLRFDLEDFFASIPAGRVYGIFRTAGYPESVAHHLTGLVTNAVPLDEWAAAPRPSDPAALQAHARMGRLLAAPHLPQGAPTSPALANLCAYRLDCRLAGLADAFAASYSRYADDLAFSGGRKLNSRAPALRRAVAAIVADEGFRLNPRKSALATRAGRQRVCGIVVNARTNAPRDDYDRLRAALHEAATRGPAAANRAGVGDLRTHLLGRIGWVEGLNPARGAKLRRKFAAVDWSRE
jgi:RNA-directed DNA polymerase